MASRKRNICFITGARAEFGLMRPVLRAIAGHPRLRLQLIVTGMHLGAAHGRSINTIRREGWTIDAVVPWSAGGGGVALARSTGRAMAGIAEALGRLHSDVALVVGDRVEAFAGAAAAHIAGIAVAHVHGGDRALGQIDDSLRHAITKLAHLHFPATRQSERRIRRLGEDPWRIVRAGSPGLDGIKQQAAQAEELLTHLPEARRGRFALLVLHPVDGDERTEARRARLVLGATLDAGVEHVIVIGPNNDPGSRGILSAWAKLPRRVTFRADVPRGLFLALMRDAAVMVGNSSAGIIEAATFGTPVVDIGPRQLGRERSGNVVQVGYDRAAITRAIRHVRRFRGANVYGRGGAAQIIAQTLATADLSPDKLRKIIAY